MSKPNDKTENPICTACLHGIVVVKDQPDYDALDAKIAKGEMFSVSDDGEMMPPIERVEEVFCSHPGIAGEDEPPVTFMGVKRCQGYAANDGAL